MPTSTNDVWAAIEPNANRKFYGIAEKVPRQFDKFFHIGSDDEPQVSSVEYAGAASLTLKPENESVQLTTLSQGPVKTWTPAIFAGAATISHEAATDVKNRYPKLGQAIGQLGEAAHVTPDLLTAIFMDRAFNSSYPATADAVEMCGTHVLPDGVTTSANELATPAALDETSAEDVRIALLGILGPSGNIRPMTVSSWIIPSAYDVIAQKLTRSDKTIGSANNAVSVVQGTTVKRFDYLSSATRWFAETSAPDKEMGLFWDWIEKVKFVTDQVPMNLQKVYIAYFRARYGIKDWRHIFGVAAT
jgi:hypothetical protein